MFCTIRVTHPRQKWVGLRIDPTLDQLRQMDDRVSAATKTLVLNDSRDRVYGRIAGGKSSTGGQKTDRM